MFTIFKKVFLISLIFPTLSLAKSCEDIGGKVIDLQAIYHTSQGTIPGFKHSFCKLHLDDGQAMIGLETLESPLSNIAASLVLNLPEIDGNDPLFSGTYSNPSLNVCHNLGGSLVGFQYHGQFTGPDGEYDICTFGDGSMISSWTLIYIANHRYQFDVIKNNIASKPL